MDVVGEGALGVNLGILASVRANPDGDAYAAHPLTASLDRALRMASKPSRYTMLLDMATMYFPILEWIPLGISAPSFRKEARVIVDVAREIVKNAKARIAEENDMDECPDILASLLRANANTSRTANEKSTLLDRNTLTDAELTAQVSTFIFAGHETTATQLSWLFLLLAQNPEKQSILRASIRSKRIEVGLAPKRSPNEAGSEELGQDDLDAITYLDWCIRESLRMHTAIHSTSRVATEPEWIPLSTGRHVQVDKGMIVLIPMSSISTSTDLWGAEPEHFRPERWSESMSGPKKYPAYYSWSFLMGPRACIGSTFEAQARAPSGPNPLDEPTLALVKQHWKQARLAKDSDRATLLGGILTDLQYAQKTKAQPNQKPPSIIKMLQKGIKKRTDAAKVFRNAKPEPRADLAEKEEREIAILQEFLPK
ncbi:hypothetical protein MCAP1_000506 [Malassezia caprae]|uniref:Altered inheritance of mitochondria protein 41 n=1 Tax=Malassezia caprae TaxID=1381934 RepID=A0AAF0E3N0_9BASI|nr:hypothetical protein MCAP1_000506 [Malassezia caprae]